MSDPTGKADVPQDLRERYKHTLYMIGITLEHGAIPNKEWNRFANELKNLIERIARLERELAESQAREARLAQPVSDEEIFQYRSHAVNGGFGHKDGLLDKAAINALLASRAAPAPADASRRNEGART